MRNFRARGMAAVILLCVFLLSGCGGGSFDSSSTSDDTGAETDNPSAYTDSYNITENLAGRWILTEGSGSATTIVSYDILSDDYEQLGLSMAANTQMNFADVSISGDVGTAMQYYSIRLRAFDTASVYRGDFEVNSYRNDDDAQKFQQVTLSHRGENIWRAENSDRDIMIMTFTSANSFNMSWQGFKYMTSGNQRRMQYYCELSCTFVKQ